MTQQNADTLHILICRDSRYNQTGATSGQRLGPTAYSIAFPVSFIKDLGFRRIILKCDNEPCTTSLQDKVVQACAAIEVIPQGPHEGESHGQRSCEHVCARSGKTMQNSSFYQMNKTQACASQMTVRHSSTFCTSSHEQDESWKGWKKQAHCDEVNEDGESQWPNLENQVWFRKIGEDGVSSPESRMTQGIFVGHHDQTGAVMCITKNGVVRGKSWTRQTLSDAWGIHELGRFVWRRGSWWLQS